MLFKFLVRGGVDAAFQGILAHVEVDGVKAASFADLKGAFHTVQLDRRANADTDLFHSVPSVSWLNYNMINGRLQLILVVQKGADALFHGFAVQSAGDS